ncbi:MAG TPA: cyclic nucleotide-binding domain-containing protein, partial [Dissulfurispiraceae bacterium]|nr:cyclic nucleotide-binding domain-containing protein [Dissulfurispiraceae bacterium]
MDIIVSGLEIDLFEKGKTIYKKGQPSENVYIIFSGLIGIFDNEDVIDYLSRGEIFGITSLFGNMLNWTASAVEDTVCYAVANREFKTILDSNERFASFFSSLLNRRFRSFKAIASDKKIIEEATFVLEVEKI